MLHNAAAVLAILMAIGTCGPSANAFSRSVDYCDRGRNGSFSDKHFSGCFRSGTTRDGHGGYDNRASDLRNRFGRCGRRDVWGHWGTYYGPMI
jgi:hypothetical protein